MAVAGVKAVPAEVVVEVIELVIEIGDDSEVEVVLVSEELVELVILVIEIGDDSEVKVVLVSEELVELVALVIEVGDKVGVVLNVLVVVDP